jgi:glutaminyl-tRNA synthetase
MPTISGLRRRGYTPASIRDFCRIIGIAKRESTVDIALLEHCLRRELNQTSPRVMGVLRPLSVVIENYPEGKTEELTAVNNPEDPGMGTRLIPFSRRLFIERSDFREEAPGKFHRLAPGREVRLRYGYYITCVGVEKDPRTGEVIELRCRYDPATRGGYSPDGRKVKGTIHWVSASHSLPAEARLYDHLFTDQDPGGKDDFIDALNPDSRETLTGCRLEPSLRGAKPGERFQFERLGYFCVDSGSRPDHPVFNRTVSLRDTWAKIEKARKN